MKKFNDSRWSSLSASDGAAVGISSQTILADVFHGNRVYMCIRRVLVSGSAMPVSKGEGDPTVFYEAKNDPGRS